MFPDSRGEAVMEWRGACWNVARACGHGGGAISYTFSAGVAEWIPGENLQSLFERADRKLYASKAAGRNRISGPPGVEAEPAARR